MYTFHLCQEIGIFNERRNDFIRLVIHSLQIVNIYSININKLNVGNFSNLIKTQNIGQIFQIITIFNQFMTVFIHNYILNFNDKFHQSIIDFIPFSVLHFSILT